MGDFDFDALSPASSFGAPQGIDMDAIASAGAGEASRDTTTPQGTIASYFATLGSPGWPPSSHFLAFSDSTDHRQHQQQHHPHDQHHGQPHQQQPQQHPMWSGVNFEFGFYGAPDGGFQSAQQL